VPQCPIAGDAIDLSIQRNSLTYWQPISCSDGKRPVTDLPSYSFYDKVAVTERLQKKTIANTITFFHAP